MKKELLEQIQKAPIFPGVYQFFDSNQKTLYVGKAKNLKKRLLSYTKTDRLTIRIQKMVSLADNLEIIQTQSETEALLLECNLIKKLMPRYNILLRDDKTFPYIEISGHEFSKISKYRGKKDKKNFYFGPFASGHYVDKVIDVLKKSFLLRSCSDSDFKNRKKPCLEYQIKRCSAPCVNYIAKIDYQKLVDEAIDFLKGKNGKIQEKLAKKMEEFSANFDYEKAAILRDRIKAIAAIQNKQNINILALGNSDIIVLVRQNNLACIYISFYRGGNNYGSKPYFINVNEDNLDNEIITNFISQFYINEIPPENILLSEKIEDKNLLEAFLNDLGKNKKVNISTPQKGEKFNLINDQLKIANQELQNKINQTISNKENLVALKKLFNLKEIPKRIEVYDNSHISGKYKVGAMICAGMEGFIKNSYRKFNIEDETIKDDTAMMIHVLTRRFKRIKAENSIKPDLVILDGGKPQLSVAKKVFDDLKIKDQTYVCISKGPKRNAGEEYFHQVGRQSFTLKKDDPIMYYLQNLRDEAHRFAITTHRAKRAKSVTKSGLDVIDDIGSKRKKLLLNHFGSLNAIKEAPIEDLCRVEGIGKKMAKKIKNSFQ